MKLTKEERADILASTNGRCAYCGCELNGVWHVDHVKPVHRTHRGMECPENDVIENMVPACKSCNIRKATLSVEQFREEIQAQANRLMRDSSQFRLAERFGVVKITSEPVIFYFEKLRTVKELAK